MPDRDSPDLPKAQVDQYGAHPFLEAFNNAYEAYGRDESHAFAVAHHAAQQAGRKQRDAGRGPSWS